MLVIAGQNDIAVNAASYLKKNFSSEWAIVLNRCDLGEFSWQRSLSHYAKINHLKIITLEQAYQSATTFISLEFDRIIRLEKFQREVKCFNFHFSLLPRYKGVATSVWPILNGDKKTGVTLHEIDHGIDTGNIIAQRDYYLDENTTALDVYMKNIAIGSSLFDEKIKSLIERTYKSFPQPSLNSSYYDKKSMDYNNREVPFNKSASQVSCFIRALTFRPFQLATFRGNPITRVKITKERSFQPYGKLLAETPYFFKVTTIDYNVILYKDMMDNLNEFSNCTVSKATKILEGLCGINDFNEMGWNPLIVAAYNGNEEVVRMLIEAGADVNARNFKGTSALMYSKDFALSSRKKNIFNYLISKGASIYIKDWNNNSLFDYLSYNQKSWLEL